MRVINDDEYKVMQVSKSLDLYINASQNALNAFLTRAFANNLIWIIRHGRDLVMVSLCELGHLQHLTLMFGRFYVLLICIYIIGLT